MWSCVELLQATRYSTPAVSLCVASETDILLEDQLNNNLARMSQWWWLLFEVSHSTAAGCRPARRLYIYGRSAIDMHWLSAYWWLVCHRLTVTPITLSWDACNDNSAIIIIGTRLQVSKVDFSDTLISTVVYPAMHYIYASANAEAIARKKGDYSN